MKIVISPAKSLDFESKLPTEQYSEASFLKEAKAINGLLKKKSPKELSKLMKISDKLSELNWQRNQDWKLPFSSENARPAVYAFNGDVYTGLDAYNLPKDKIERLQSSLRILSGLYGVLKPLDLMQAYRLEMGTKFPVGESKNLHSYWEPLVTEMLNSELEEEELFVNLASNEYFSAVNVKELKSPVITPIFKDWKNDKLKVISFFAKKARGLMVRYILDTDVKSIEDLKGFNYEGYSFSEEYSNMDKNELVFIR
ncbi:MAG: peroxide stress protein YaaA [Flavobacteriaceae bacterium]|nr:peroxide stress protein YaaA [Flavobacteriaceae bacterium]